MTSVDLARLDQWTVIGQPVLDAAGRGTFTDAIDPRSSGVAVMQDYFRFRSN